MLVQEKSSAGDEKRRRGNDNQMRWTITVSIAMLHSLFVAVGSTGRRGSSNPQGTTPANIMPIKCKDNMIPIKYKEKHNADER